jgi:gliding-associated putative ABC transporter substrate-binding component GldG
MSSRSLKAQALGRIAIVAVILILLNVVSIRVFGRLDLTERGLFSLAEASKELVRNLDDRVTVRVYFTPNLPSPYNTHYRALVDQLNEYKAYAGGNLQIEFIDPSGEKGEQEAQQQGIAPVQVQVLEQDKFEIKRAYMGMVFLYEDKREVIPVMRGTSSLEYDISSTIRRLTTRVQKKIGFTTGHGEPGLNELQRFRQLVERQYELTTVDLSTAEPVPQDVAALIVMAPNSRYSDQAKYALDQYIMRGGRVAFLLNKVDANLQNRFGRAVEHGLEDLLETYGLRINPDLVRDAQCASVNIVQQQMGFSFQSQVPFPYLPMASDFNRENIMVKDLQALVFFFVSSVDTVRLASRNLRGELLIRSSSQSGRQTQFFYIDPVQQFTRQDFSEQGIPLGALVQGEFPSHFAERPAPGDTTGGAIAPVTERLSRSLPTRITLVGDGDFARDQYLGNVDNLTLLANMVDYLVDDAGLITIRTKDVTLPPLDQVSDTARDLIKYGNMIIPPAIVVAVGLLRWRIRKARKRALSQ